MPAVGAAFRVVVEGWRFLPHSFVTVNAFQCLEFLRRPNISLFHVDRPYLMPGWKSQAGLFPPTYEDALKKIPPPNRIEPDDRVIRISVPHDFRPSPAKRVYTFCVTESGAEDPRIAESGVSFAECTKRSGATIVTPSAWSRDRLVERGAPPERIRVLPHGFDPAIFRPPSEAERQSLRRQLGFDGFIFLNIGSLSGNKGIRMLLYAFAQVAEKHPDARLFVKGLDQLYPSRKKMEEGLAKVLGERARNLVLPRLSYLGGTFGFTDIAALYQAADIYVAPYVAEGFNLPVMEAAACGCPVICTQGGPTDEFTRPDFVLGVESKLQAATAEGRGKILVPDPASLVAQMERALNDTAYRAQARAAGPAYMNEHFTWAKIIDRWLELFSQDC